MLSNRQLVSNILMKLQRDYTLLGQKKRFYWYIRQRVLKNDLKSHSDESMFEEMKLWLDEKHQLAKEISLSKIIKSSVHEIIEKSKTVGMNITT